MPSREEKLYRCSACGYRSASWMGRCPSCGAWKSFEEALSEAAEDPIGEGEIERLSLDGFSPHPSRIATGSAELDRVLGGGLVPGSALLLSGEPGVGKSTLLLQVADAVALSTGRRAVYATGEESVHQVGERAARMGLKNPSVEVIASSKAEVLLRAAGSGVGLLVVDSVQTVGSSKLDSPPGTPSQVRAVAELFVRSCKERGFPLFLVGHITKEGLIAGPKALEHLVDVVLQMEGERSGSLRVLRSLKNRFGPTDELGLFEMTEEGLKPIENPYEHFVSPGEAPGAAVASLMEGRRPLFLEVQALLCQSAFPYPRRVAFGLSSSKLLILLAVLEQSLGLKRLRNMDVYVNVSGGIRPSDPAIDLAVCASVISALEGFPLSKGWAFCGEVGLSGEVKRARGMSSRLKEARRLGFKAVWANSDEADGTLARARDLRSLANAIRGGGDGR